ncbi:undecaprenyl-phosphate alpha-N-acetylglucosaminyl 1-phosphate transferase, partial [Vibrio sp. TH_r3]|nr:undecaprenyl-phosphate alpha-N-acetylglucosaminyl 1-phosphate transferase [Vibrio sp. TH_r3]
MLLELSFIGFFTFSSLFLLRKVAKTIGLVDKPNKRKLHNGAIPLVGGIAISLSISQYLVTHPDVIPHSQIFLASIA